MILSDIVINLHFRDLNNSPIAVTDRILEIRNEANVRKNMYTDHVISKLEHAEWLTALSTAKDDRKFFAVLKDDEVIGGVGLSAINNNHKRADWAYFLSESAQGMGVGAAVEFKLLDFAFDVFDLKKLNCEVIAWNASVLKLHKRFGFVEEGLRRHHVRRGGQPHDVVLMGVTYDEWRNSRAKLTDSLFRGLDFSRE